MEKTDKDKFTPLLIAARYGHLGSFKKLLDLGANLLVTDKTEQTALHFACQNNNLAILQEVVEHRCGADLLLVGDCYGYQPLHIACQEGYTDCVKVSIISKQLIHRICSCLI